MKAKRTKNCEKRSALGQKGNVDRKRRRTSGCRDGKVHLQSTCGPEFFVRAQTTNFACNGQLSGAAGRRMRDVDINALNFLRLDDFGVAANDKVAAVVLETFF